MRFCFSEKIFPMKKDDVGIFDSPDPRDDEKAFRRERRLKKKRPRKFRDWKNR